MNRHQGLRQIATAAVGNVLPPLAAIVTAPILAQVLGASGRGVTAAAVAPLVLAVTACGFGVPESLTYHVARGLRTGDRVVSRMLQTLFGLGLVGSAALALLAPALSAGDQDVAALITTAGLALAPSLLVYGFRGVASGAGRWRLVTSERLASSALRLILVVTFAALHLLTVQTATAILALTSFAGGVVYVALRRPASSSDPEGAGSAGATTKRQIFRFSGQVWLGTLTGILLARLDQTVMLPLSDATQLGLYAVAVSVCETTLVVNSAARDVLFTRVSAGSYDVRALAAASRLSTLATGAFSLCVAAVAWFAVPLFFGEEFVAALPPIWILLIAITLGNPGSIAGAGLSGTGRPGLRSISLAAGLATNVAALVVLVPPLGAVGAAFATLGGNVVAGYANIVWLRLRGGMSIRDFLGLRTADLRTLVSLMPRRKGAPLVPALPGTSE